MGIIIAKFRKKQSTFDILSNLEDEILSIEEFQKRTQQTQRKIVFRFLFLAILVNAALAFLVYIYFSQITENQKLLWITPMIIVFPLVIWFIKKFLTWYYNRKLKKNEKKLITLKEKKKKILENVMETETYKVAKQILDKFGTEPKKSLITTPFSIQKSTATPSYSATPYNAALRQRTIAAQNALRGRASFGAPQTPQTQRLALPPAPSTNQRSINALQTPRALTVTPALCPSLPRSILPRDRSVLDKMVDYLVGDGPSNRYALICQKCSSHNGMALKEEFEYMAFRCCYCDTFNPARKKRPVGPKFESPLMLTPAKSTSHLESSDSEKNSESDSDADNMPIVEEPRSDSPDTARTSDFEKVSDSELAGHDEENKMEIDDIQSDRDTAKTTDINKEGGDNVDTSKGDESSEK